MKKKGILLTLSGGTMWGFSGACSQYLFMHTSLAPIYLTAYRMLFAGLLLVGIALFSKKRELFAIFRDPRDIASLIAFGILGLAACQFTYLKAIETSNAGIATVLQYLFPLYIMMITCIREHRFFHRYELIAVCLALGGTFLLATHGHLHQMVLTKQGLMWGMISSFACVSYSMLPRRLMKQYGSLVVTSWGMLFGGLVINIAAPFYHSGVVFKAGDLLALTGVIVIGTALAFTLYLSGVNLIGPVKASLIASIEPVSATAFAFFWLKADFQAIDFVGIAMIITMIIILSLTKSET